MEHLRGDATWADIEKALVGVNLIDKRVFSITSENRMEKDDLYIRTNVTITFPAGFLPKGPLYTFTEAEDMLKEVGVTRDSVFYGVNRGWLHPTIASTMTSCIQIKINTHVPKSCLVKV